jgi:hypothetical protein
MMNLVFVSPSAKGVNAIPKQCVPIEELGGASTREKTRKKISLC